MTKQLSRITFRNATLNGLFAENLTVTGFIEKQEPNVREILRPVEPDEPDTEIDVGYSKNPLEPLTIEHRKRKVELTKTLYILFRYINDLYLAEEQTEFEFLELSEFLRRNGYKSGRRAIESSIRRIALALSKIIAPITLVYNREVVHVRHQN